MIAAEVGTADHLHGGIAKTLRGTIGQKDRVTVMNREGAPKTAIKSQTGEN